MANRNISEMTGVLGLARNSAVSAPTFKTYGTWYSGGSATTTKPHFLIEPTGTTSTGWHTGGTGFGVNAASGFTGNLLDLQVAGVSKFKVSSTGLATTTGNIIFNEAGGLAPYISASTYQEMTIGHTTLSFIKLNTAGVGNILLSSYVSVIEQRNSTNAQEFRIYNTYTDASNYERGFVKWSANALKIGCEAAGTGTTRVVHISNLPTSNPGAGILWNNAGTPAIGT